MHPFSGYHTPTLQRGGTKQGRFLSVALHMYVFVSVPSDLKLMFAGFEEQRQKRKKGIAMGEKIECIDAFLNTKKKKLIVT